MSKVHMEEITCISCGAKVPHRIWDRIDPMFQKETKEKVLSGELFTFTCPHCGFRRRVTYDTIYQEIAKGRTFHLVTSEESYAQAINLYADRDQHSGEVLANEIVRIVLSQNQLAEKIRIFDANLDDRVIEMLKAMYLQELEKQCPDITVDEILFFINEDGQYEIAFLCPDGNHRSIQFSRELYDNIWEDIGRRLPSSNQEIEVDMEIALEYLQYR